MKGTQAFCLLRATRAPAWDLSLALDALLRLRSNPWAHVGLKQETFKTVFLLAISSAKQVSEAVHPADHWLVLEFRWPRGHSGRTQCLSILPIQLAPFDPPPEERWDRPELLCPGSTLQLLWAFRGLISSFSVVSTVCPTGELTSSPVHTRQLTVSFHLVWSVPSPGVLLHHWRPLGEYSWRTFVPLHGDTFSLTTNLTISLPQQDGLTLQRLIDRAAVADWTSSYMNKSSNKSKKSGVI